MSNESHFCLFSQKEEFSRGNIDISCFSLGADASVLISGGETPHIGALALASPHPSLANPAEVSSTCSVLALPQHREDQLARSIALRLAAAWNCVVSVACGIHIDAASSEEIQEIQMVVERLVTDAERSR